MSKYFTKDSVVFSNLTFEEEKLEENKKAIPLTDNLTNPLPNEIKNKLQKKKQKIQIADEEDTYIEDILEQSEHISKVIKDYADSKKEEIDNKFNKFAPAEMFEKINQLIYVVTQLNNRLVNIEDLLKNSNSLETNNKELTQHKIENTQIVKKEDKSNSENQFLDKSLGFKNKDVEMPSIEQISKHLASLSSGGKGTIPIENYLDSESVKLEEIFPHLDDEAYQAGYSTMLKYKNQQNKQGTQSNPAPGSMKGIIGF